MGNQQVSMDIKIETFPLHSLKHNEYYQNYLTSNGKDIIYLMCIKSTDALKFKNCVYYMKCNEPYTCVKLIKSIKYNGLDILFEYHENKLIMIQTESYSGGIPNIMIYYLDKTGINIGNYMEMQVDSYPCLVSPFLSAVMNDKLYCIVLQESRMKDNISYKFKMQSRWRICCFDLILNEWIQCDTHTFKSKGKYTKASLLKYKDKLILDNKSTGMYILQHRQTKTKSKLIERYIRSFIHWELYVPNVINSLIHTYYKGNTINECIPINYKLENEYWYIMYINDMFIQYRLDGEYPSPKISGKYIKNIRNITDIISIESNSILFSILNVHFREPYKYIILDNNAYFIDITHGNIHILKT